MSCLDDDTMLGLIEGRLDGDRLAAADDHLDGCATCRDVVTVMSRGARGRALDRGQVVGRYVVGDLLGAGAMGRVYSAWEPELDRRVAIKLLRDDTTTDQAAARQRLVREAQAMARLSHPNVVTVHEVGTVGDDVFVAMELVDGMTLRGWAAEPRDWRAKAAILADVARGLAAVHAAGVVHRDVKPDNIIVGGDGRARLGDFGLARRGAGAVQTAPDLVSTTISGVEATAVGTPAALTATGAVVGTPAYMAPQLARGEPADERSDQFSFGVMAFEIAHGRRPFDGATRADLARAAEAGTIVDGRGDVPGWLDAIVRRCVAADPAKRFVSMTAVADAIVERLARARRRPAVWIAGGVGVAALASAITVFAVGATGGPDLAAATCDRGGLAIAEVWNDAARVRVGSDRVVTAVDAWARGWAGERDATCRAATYESPARIAARERCLDSRRAELGALVARLPESPTAGAEYYRSPAANLIDALAALPSPAECGDAAIETGDALPLDPERAVAARDVAAGLPAVRAAIALGDARPVIATAETLVARASAADHAPTEADALLALAEALRATGQFGDADAAARGAVLAADRGHADVVSARAWVERVAIAGARRDLGAADDRIGHAEATIARALDPPRLAARLAVLRGLVAYNRGRLVEARTILDDARRRWVAIAGERSVDVARVDSALGSVARADDRLDDAARHHQASLDTHRALHGASHPSVALDLHNVAGVLRLRGDLDAALATYRDALAIEIAVRGERDVAAGLTHNSIGLVLMEREEWAGARAELVVSREILTAADHGDRGFAEHNLGLVAQALGEHRVAIEHFDRAAAVYAATIGRDAPAPIRLIDDRATSERALRGATRPRPEPAPPVDPVRRVPPPDAAAPPIDAPPGRRDVGVYGSGQNWGD